MNTKDGIKEVEKQKKNKRRKRQLLPSSDYVAINNGRKWWWRGHSAVNDNNKSGCSTTERASCFFCLAMASWFENDGILLISASSWPVSRVWMDNATVTMCALCSTSRTILANVMGCFWVLATRKWVNWVAVGRRMIAKFGKTKASLINGTRQIGMSPNSEISATLYMYMCTLCSWLGNADKSLSKWFSPKLTNVEWEKKMSGQMNDDVTENWPWMGQNRTENGGKRTTIKKCIRAEKSAKNEEWG